MSKNPFTDTLQKRLNLLTLARVENPILNSNREVNFYDPSLPSRDQQHKSLIGWEWAGLYHGKAARGYIALSGAVILVWHNVLAHPKDSVRLPFCGSYKSVFDQLFVQRQFPVSTFRLISKEISNTIPAESIDSDGNLVCEVIES